MFVNLNVNAIKFRNLRQIRFTFLFATRRKSFDNIKDEKWVSWDFSELCKYIYHIIADSTFSHSWNSYKTFPVTWDTPEFHYSGDNELVAVTIKTKCLVKKEEKKVKFPRDNKYLCDNYCRPILRFLCRNISNISKVASTWHENSWFSLAPRQEHFRLMPQQPSSRSRAKRPSTTIAHHARRIQGCSVKNERGFKV